MDGGLGGEGWDQGWDQHAQQFCKAPMFHPSQQCRCSAHQQREEGQEGEQHRRRKCGLAVVLLQTGGRVVGGWVGEPANRNPAVQHKGCCRGRSGCHAASAQGFARQAAAPSGTSWLERQPTLYDDSTNSVSVCVCPMMLPLMTATAPNSPIARWTGEEQGCVE